MHDGEPALGAPEIQSRAQTFASLRSAQRALRGLVQPVELERTLEHGRALLRRLRELGQGADDDPLPAGALEDADALLDGIAEQTRRLLGSVSLQELRSQLPRVAREEPSSIPALARLVLGGDVESDPTLRVFEYLITMLCCEERDGDKVVCRSPVAVLPELAQLSARWVEAGDPRCHQARETLESATAELADGRLGQIRDRIRSYKEGIGVRILEPDVLAAAVAYNAAMANWFSRLLDGHRALDTLAKELLDPPRAETAPGASRSSAHRALPGAALPRGSARSSAVRTGLFWQLAAAFGIGIALLLVTPMLWPSPAVEVLAGEEVLRLSPHLEKGYVSVDDGVQRFVGTVAPTWGGLAHPDRRQIVARVASALNRHGVESLILVDADHAIQARYENRTLLWLAPPETAGG